MPDLRNDLATFVEDHIPSAPACVRADKIIHDAIWGTVTLRKHEVALLDTALMQRLRGVHQTSSAYLTYPSAMHSRFEHSLGCLCVASRFIEALRQRDQQAGRKLITDDLDDNVRAAALLHDVGHGAFSHSSEEIYTHYASFLEVKPSFKNYSAHGHEILSCLMIQSPPFQRFLEKLNTKYGRSLSSSRIADAVGGRDNPDRQFEIEIINGPFDVDKLDYVMRDGHLIGLPVAIDIHRFFTAIDIDSDQQTGTRRLIIDLKGEATLEQIIFGKMTLFACVYRHHKVRAADCVLKGVLMNTLENERSLSGLLLWPMTSPVDFLRWPEGAMIPDGVRVKKTHPALHELMHDMSYRRLPKRALVISKDSILNPKSKGYADFLELRLAATDSAKKIRDLSDEIWDRSGKLCLRELVWLDVPRPPSLGEGRETSVRKPNGKLCRLNDLFEIDQWSEHYDQHKWVAHVFAPGACSKRVSEAARAVLKDKYGLEFAPLAWEMCHLD